MTQPHVIASVHAYGEMELTKASDKPADTDTEEED